MAGIDITSGVINYGGVPSAGAGLLANRPAAGVTGRLFIGTDTNILYRDTGSTWVTIGGSGTVTGSGAAGQATFWTGASAISGDNAFFWDNTNKRLGLGTNTPGVRLDIHGTGVIQQLNGTTTNSAFLDFQNAGTTQWRVGNNYNGGNRLFQVIDQAGGGRNSILINNANQISFFNTGTTFTGANATMEIYGTLNGSESFIRHFNYNSASNQGCRYDQRYTRTNTVGSFAATQNGDVFGGISCYGSTNSGWAAGYFLSIQQNAAIGTTCPSIAIHEVFGTAAIANTFRQSSAGFSDFSTRVNVNNATDNSLFELNVNGNTYTGGLSPTILTVSGNTTMARTVTGYYCTATLTLTLPSAASLNNVYWVIAGPGATITVNRAGTDDILNLAGASVTSITISPNQRAMFYVGGGTRTFLIFQA